MISLNIEKTLGYNKKYLIRNADMEIGSNKDINKGHEKLPVTSLKLSRAEDVAPKMVKSTDKQIKDSLPVRH